MLEESGTETASMVQRAKDIHLTILEGAKAFMRCQVTHAVALSSPSFEPCPVVARRPLTRGGASSLLGRRRKEVPCRSHVHRPHLMRPHLSVVRWLNRVSVGSRCFGSALRSSRCCVSLGKGEGRGSANRPV